LHPIYYDYAHHPTEIRAGIETLKDLYPGKVTVVFRPHTFSRTEALFADFSAALKMADRVIVTDIDGARESGNADLARSLSASAGGLYVPLSCLEDVVTKEKDGPLVFMGAGDFSSVLAALALGDAENKKDS
jgi:UDP-N-acetylmuramate--alanine ligase